MKLQIIIDHLRYDGTQTFLLYLVRLLSRHGAQIEIVVLNRSFDEKLLTDLKAISAIRFVGIFPLLFMYGVFQHLRLTSISKPDLILSLLSFSHCLGAITKWKLKIRHFIRSPAAFRRFSFVRDVFLRLSRLGCDGVVAVSKSTGDYETRILGVNPALIKIINNVPTIDFSGVAETVQRSPQVLMQKEVIQFLSVGRLEWQKGLDIALRAMSQLKEYSFEYTIIGDGRQLRYLQELTISLGLEERVKFVGRQKDSHSRMFGTDCFLFPSRFEGMSFALLEACFLSPVIICSSISENVSTLKVAKRDNALLFESESVESLVTVLSEFLSTPKPSIVDLRASQNKLCDLTAIHDELWLEYLGINDSL